MTKAALALKSMDTRQKDLNIRIADGIESKANTLRQTIFPLSKYMAWAGAFMVAFLGVITFYDVAMRLIFNHPTASIMEFSEFSLAIIVFLGIAYTATQKGHVSVDILTNKFSPKVMVVTASANTLLAIYLFFLMGWQQIEKAVISHKTFEITQVAHMPYYPLLIFIALGCAVMIFVLLVEYIELQAELFRITEKPFVWVITAVLASIGILFLPLILQPLSINVSAFATGLIGVAMLMVFIFSGLPIGFAMGIVGIIGAWYAKDFNMAMVSVQITVLPSVGQYFYTVVPLFVGMGFVCFAAELSKDLYSSFYKIFGGIPGALAMASVTACGAFAAICGDSGATGATMASVAIPEMEKAKYKGSLAAGCIAAGGTLGILIPPSVGFIIYGLITEQSIGKLFMAGVIPGGLLVILFCTIIYIQCKINPAAGPASPSVPLVSRIGAVKGMLPIVILVLIVMGGMVAGIFTATEAGGVGFVSSVLIGLVMKRLTWKKMHVALMDTVTVTAMVFTIMIGVSLLNNFMGISEFPLTLGSWVASLDVSRYIVLLMVMCIYLLLGCTMNIIPMIMLTLPIIYPLVTGLNFDPIWFGVVMVLLMEMGQITPPVGINVFIIGGVAKEIPMKEIFKGIFPFLLMQVLMIILLILFPDIAMYLPDHMGGLPPLPE